MRRSLFTSEIAQRQAQLDFAWPRRKIALCSRGGLCPYPPGLDLVLSVRLTLLAALGSSRGSDGDGVKEEEDEEEDVEDEEEEVVFTRGATSTQIMIR